MAPARKRTNNIARRRRLDDEDESQSVATELVDDSQSDVSVPSDIDEDANADADNSDLSDADSGVAPTEGKPKRRPNGARNGKAAPAVNARQPSPPIARSDAAFTALKDTEAMMNGLSITDAANTADEVDFETGEPAETAPAVGPPSARPETLGDRRRREHEEYKKKRDSDPAFIPNRGAFFMHDSRSAPGQNGFRPIGGRGRGRGGIGGPFSPANLRQHAPEATDSPWQHDLHEAVNAPHQPTQQAPPSNFPHTTSITRLTARPKGALRSRPETTPGSQLLHHCFGRGRGRFGSIGGGGFSSRRTSAYGGSVYSPSVALSRRSSIARDNMVSPAGSIMSRNGSFIDPNRPVVRLPPGNNRMPTGPAIISPTNGSYPPPQKPAFRENWAQGQLPMHQPRPQKNVNVAGIESPASMNFNPPLQQEQQPFHQQVPAHIRGAGSSGEQPGFYQHARQPSYPGQVSTGTPLNNIPASAAHAAAFQPFQPGYQPQPFVPGGYYYPPSAPQQPYMAPGGMVPMFVPGAQQPYAMPAPAPPVAPPAPAAAGPPNMVAVEQNGMTFYMDANQLSYAPPADTYAQPSYTMPGMGGMMTPAPDNAYYSYPQQMQPTAFYPQQ
ncbi:hypothetical protein N0V86_002859 [Didymella sp. IMI 355093]|nr:hypothetical protein N0V86_002859 [Didymella sp. IMI 355093]